MLLRWEISATKPDEQSFGCISTRVQSLGKIGTADAEIKALN